MDKWKREKTPERMRVRVWERDIHREIGKGRKRVREIRVREKRVLYREREKSRLEGQVDGGREKGNERVVIMGIN